MHHAEESQKILTIGMIADVLGVSVGRVKSILRSRSHITHSYRVGNSRARLFAPDVLPLIRHELNAIDAQRAQRLEPVAPDVAPCILTAGKIADELKVSVHRVNQILRSRPHICHRFRAGKARTRLYDREAIDQVRAELIAIDAAKEHRQAKDSSQALLFETATEGAHK